MNLTANLDIVNLLIFLIPVYLANSSPVVLGGGAPLDFGIRFADGERLLGNSKTIRGFLAGVLAGTVAGGIVALFYQLPFFQNASAQFLGAFVLAFGTMSGDALGSFIKRRAGIGSGKPFVLDTLIFVVVALAFVFPLADARLYDPFNLLFILLLSVILHPLANFFANRAGLKNVPW